MNHQQLVMPIIPIDDLKRVFRSNEAALAAATQAVLASGWWLNGEQHERFCEEFASYVGATRCIGVANGTDALEIAMRALLQVRGRDQREVVTVANAGGYSTVVSRLLGLTPVYADIEEATQLACLDSMISCISEDTALVVATHLYGGALDVPRLRKMLDEAGHADVPILEDCAQAHGARLGDTIVGSLGDIAAFSFYPTKNLGALGDAGAVVTSYEELAKAVAAGTVSGRFAGIGHHSSTARVSTAGERDHLPDRDLVPVRAAQKLDQRGRSNDCLQAAAVAAAAHVSGVVHRDMSDLARHPARPPVQATLQDQPAADSR